MRFSSALFAAAFLACGFLLGASAASADSRVFIVANQAEATASTSASPGARNAVPMLPAPTANHGNLLPPPPIAVSIPTKLPARCRAAARNAQVPSPLPASA